MSKKPNKKLAAAIPADLGPLLYIQSIDVLEELSQRRPGLTVNLVVLIFGLVMGALAFFHGLVSDRGAALLLGTAVSGVMGWGLWVHIQNLTRVRVGFVCERGLGCFFLNAQSAIVGRKLYRFTPESWIDEQSGRAGPLARMHHYSSLKFMEGVHGVVKYRITFDDAGRTGYGSAEPDDPDRLEYLAAKEAFEAYRERNPLA